MAEARPEPSMEDILASIKRIISEDQTPPPQPAAAPRPAVASQPASSRPVASAQPISPPVPSQPEPAPTGWPQPAPLGPGDSILELTQRVPERPAPRVPDRTAETLAPPRYPAEPAAPVQRAVERLRQAEAEMPQPAAPRPVPRDLLPRTPAPRPTGGDITLDALVREALQPLLSDWIERNLPDMVERLVQAEIRRMTERDS